jgi:hypothetical protein
MFPLLGWLRGACGYDKYSAETIDRLVHSKHVQDLRWIANIGGLVAVLGVVSIVFMLFAKRPFSEIVGLLTALIATVGGIFAWCYQTGSARLGVVDLFACEITTICRICTINGLAETCISAFQTAMAGAQSGERFTHFDSTESYTPVFDGNAKQLQNLSVKVVINITAFYTYWKATRDAFRRLAKTPLPVAVAPIEAEGDAWHLAMRHVIYMQFLCMESARKTVRDLIEYEPNSAENTITILLSELAAYGFLKNKFKEEDVRNKRLALRQARYEVVVPKVYRFTEEEHKKYHDKEHSGPRNLEESRRDWDKAYEMLPQLEFRYFTAIGKSLSESRVRPSEGETPYA